ncbi:hypothetical protein [Burkholderia ubonensis]|uniref:hypothetical protein n=1 Tax=Burkholderia ubonensis TaxID=101571 RepID=UPI000AC00FBA|nr:hypothetical protein [Burkholderia ubonensis]
MSRFPEQHDEIGTVSEMGAQGAAHYADFVVVLNENPQAGGRATEEAVLLSPLSDDA